MIEHEILITEFLTAAGWQNSTGSHLAGDASGRLYTRLKNENGDTAILMEMPPSLGSVKPFLTVGTHLDELGFSPPKVLFCDEVRGLLLLEDLGDDLFSRVAHVHPEKEQELYETAIDFLIALHRYPPPDFCAQHTAGEMAQAAGLAYEFYAPKAAGKNKDAALELLRAALKSHRPFAPVLALRDFHSENLIWLPARAGSKRIGLLDFQDAFACHPAYDLVSLTEDARRDVPLELAQDLTERYIRKTGQDEKKFRAAAAEIAAQRNLRILGVFARLALRYGKPAYLDLTPRVWSHLLRDLAHPDLTDLRERLLADLPEPTPQYLKSLGKHG